MRFLLDQELSPAVAALLIDAGHDAVHLQGLGLSRAPDESVMARAVDDDRVLISADTDFCDLLSRSNTNAPST